MYNSVRCDSCRAAELMFEKYKAPALFLAKNAVSE
jgi:actin-related protein